VEIREATAAELAEIGEIRVGAYLAGGFLRADSGYATTLRSLGADGAGVVLVAVEPGDELAAGPSGAAADGSQAGRDRIVGTIMFQAWPQAGEIVAGPHEAEIRALAVRPLAQGSGVGRALVQAVIERAAKAGVTHLVLSTAPEMRAAHRIYERAGFARLPDRDWSPAPGALLLAYGLRLG